MIDDSPAITQSVPAAEHPHRQVNIDADAGLLFLERRCHRRQPASGRVTAVVYGRDRGEGATHRIYALELTDRSPTGLGAMVQEPLPVGARITVFCPTRSQVPALDLHGIIVRCQAHGQGHRVGIRIDARTAA